MLGVYRELVAIEYSEECYWKGELFEKKKTVLPPNIVSEKQGECGR